MWRESSALQSRNVSRKFETSTLLRWRLIVANAAPLDPERLIKILAKQRIRFASIGDVNIMYLNFSVGPAELLEFIASHRSRSLPAVTKEQPSKFF